jgi:hypothetical protein
MMSWSVTVGNECQASISYIGNLAHTPPDDVLLVESDEDYVRVCRALSHRTKLDTAAKVWVRSKNHFAWLRDFTEQIGCSSRFEEKTARLVLAEQWNVQLPDWLTDTDVLDHDLLEIYVGWRSSPHEFRKRGACCRFSNWSQTWFWQTFFCPS